MKQGDTLVNKTGKLLTLVEWLPNAGFTTKGKWFCKDSKGTTCQLSELELGQREYTLYAAISLD